MSAVIACETKWRAVGRYTPEQARRWLVFLRRHEPSGRAVPVDGTSSLLGSDWVIECDDAEHAKWLCDWLISDCGFVKTMLKVAS